MKYLLVGVLVPDCFTTNVETVQVHFKGMPEGKYLDARMFPKGSNDLNRRLKEETDKALEKLLIGGATNDK